MTDYEEVLPRVCKEKLSGIILKPEQQEVIISPLNGKDVLSCYQPVLVKSYLPKLVFVFELSRPIASRTCKTVNRLARKQLHFNHVVPERPLED